MLNVTGLEVTSSAEEKKLLRAEMRRRREALPAEFRHAASAAICARLLQLPLEPHQAVAIYLAKPPEVDIDAAIQAWLLRHTRVFAPLFHCRAQTGFAEVENLQDLQPGPFGIRQPVDATERRVKLSDIRAMILPGLAFDEKGGRLGQGGGWYDRALETAGDILAVGVCYEAQIIPRVPLEAHDRRVSCIVTEKRIIRCGSASE